MRNLSATLLTALAICGLSLATAWPTRAERVLQGAVCSQRIHQLTNDIDWHKSLSKAQEDARREGKLVFWVHMLGKIDGAT